MKFDHIGVYVQDFSRSVAWYSDVFGFKEAYRMRDGGIDIVFMDMGGGLIQLKKRSDPPKGGGDKWVHFAWSTDDYPALLRKLKERGIEYWEIHLADGTRSANFQDPDGHDLEVASRPFIKAK